MHKPKQSTLFTQNTYKAENLYNFLSINYVHDAE
jgi:hypothetical protein